MTTEAWPDVMTTDSSATGELPPYDSILLVSFGGPEHRDDVIPFLENVLRGRPVPRERMLEVAEHYYHFGGVSPINQQCRDLITAVTPLIRQAGCDLPLFWGNRNWHPLLTDTIREMREQGLRRTATFVTSAFSSYSGCRQYRENCYAACDAAGPGAPRIEKIRVFYNHPLFISACADRIREALGRLPTGVRETAHIAFTAHSIPLSMANSSRYVEQLEETCRLVAEALHVPDDRYKLVYQSRSGRPEDPWLEPDISEHLAALSATGVPSVVISPIGFLSDHMEIPFDLDEQAADTCQKPGLPMARAGTVGLHPDFVRMVSELIVERVTGSPDKPAIGRFGPSHDVCPDDCCPGPQRPSRPASGAPGGPSSGGTGRPN